MHYDKMHFIHQKFLDIEIQMCNRIYNLNYTNLIISAHKKEVWKKNKSELRRPEIFLFDAIDSGLLR